MNGNFDENFTLTEVCRETVVNREGSKLARWKLTLVGRGGLGIGLTGLVVHAYVSDPPLSATEQGLSCRQMLESHLASQLAYEPEDQVIT
jgi:hypothetical protein